MTLGGNLYILIDTYLLLDINTFIVGMTAYVIVYLIKR